MYAVFRLRRGKWIKLHTFPRLTDAQREARYQQQMLGIKCQVFKKK